jgi:hypothetical protein
MLIWTNLPTPAILAALSQTVRYGRLEGGGTVREADPVRVEQSRRALQILCQFVARVEVQRCNLDSLAEGIGQRWMSGQGPDARAALDEGRGDIAAGETQSARHDVEFVSRHAFLNCYWA